MIDGAAKMREIEPRIVITVEGGMISGVYAEGVPNAAGIAVVVLDYDTRNDDHMAVTINGSEADFSVDGLAELDPNVARDVGAAYDNWALS